MAQEKKIQKGLSSRFSIAWWFCHFLTPRMQWCSLSGGRRSIWRRLKRRDGGGKIETVPREVQSITNILHPENNWLTVTKNVFKNTATKMNCMILHFVQTALTEKQLAPHQDSVSGPNMLLIIRSQVDISIRVSSRQAWKCVSCIFSDHLW